MAKSVSVTLQYIYPKRLESKTIPNMVTVVVVEINLIFYVWFLTTHMVKVSLVIDFSLYLFFTFFNVKMQKLWVESGWAGSTL